MSHGGVLINLNLSPWFANGNGNAYMTGYRQILTYGRRIPIAELDARIEQVDAKTLRDTCMKYIYDRCPVVAGIGE